MLKEFKKSVLNKLFSREIRFSNEDGSYPDWKEFSFNEIAKIYDGTHSTPKYVEDGVPFYSVEHITRKDFSKTKFITEEVFQKECKRVIIERGDILMTRIGDVGSPKYVDWDVRASFYVSLALIKLSDDFSGVFISQYLEGSFFQRELYKKTIHVAFPKKINLGEIGKCKLYLPCLEEQLKIAHYLFLIDRKIDLIECK